MQANYPYFILTAIVLGFLLLNALAFKRGLVLPFWYELVLATVLILFSGLRTSDVDFGGYQEIFGWVKGATGQSLIQQAMMGKDVLFGLILVAVNALGLGTTTFLLISALLSVSIKVAAFRYAFGSSILGLGIYFCAFYFLHDFTQIRLAIALALCFLALICLVKNKRLFYILFCVLAAGFHAQTLLFTVATLPLLTQLKYKYWFVFGTIVAAGVAVSSFNFLLDFSYRAALSNGLINLKLTAVTAFALSTAIIGAAYYGAMGCFKNAFDQEIAKVSMFLYGGGFLFFFTTIATSNILAWRVYEMFFAFGTFVIITTFRASFNIISIAAGLSFIALNLIITMRSALLVPYSIQNSLRAMYGIFQ